MELIGVIESIGQEQTFGSNGFRKRTFLIKTDSQYDDAFELELVQDNCALIDAFAVGQSIKCHINLKSRKWTNPQNEDKYFPSIQAWRIEANGTAQAPQAPAAPSVGGENKEDDLPF